jgi:hypothetical protein
VEFCEFVIDHLQSNHILLKRFVCWWSLFYKQWSSQFEKHALLICFKSSLASASQSSTVMESERLVWHCWQSYHWPYFNEGSLTGCKHRASLSKTLVSHSERFTFANLPDSVVLTWWFSCTLCTCREKNTSWTVLRFLDQTQWTREVATTFTRFNPVWFFLWGTVKDKVYEEPPTTAEEMQQSIITACAAASLKILQSPNYCT